MKKYFALLLVLALCVSLTACSEDTQIQKPKQPPNLAGEWKQVNSSSEDAYHAATITADTITIFWVSDGGDTKSLYWAGSFIPPTTADEPYSWNSTNDKEQTDSALLASGDDMKTFTYDGGQISYEASAFGTTTTIRIDK